MNTEVISAVEILENGELLLCLESGGKPSYQYVYRTAVGVHWDSNRKAFKFSTRNDRQYAKWFEHIVKVARDEMGLYLQLADGTAWKNVPKEDKDAIQRAAI